MNGRIGKRLLTPLTSVLALVAALCVGAVVIAINGDSPIQAYR